VTLQSKAQSKALTELKANHPDEYAELYRKWCIEFGSFPRTARLDAIKLLQKEQAQ
jgi:hypothetical protein